MRTLANLSIEEIRVVQSVEQQITEALTRIANRVSVQGLPEAVMRILKTTERCSARLDRIPHEIEPAGEDETSFHPSGKKSMRGAFVRNAPRARRILSSNYTRLTSRQAEVLKLIAEGRANKQIAAELAISIKTVEKHRQRMMAKLDLHDTAGVTRYAIAAGFVEANA